MSVAITKKDLVEILDKKFSEQDQRIDKKFSEQDKRIDRKFDAQDKRIDRKFDAQDKRIDSKFDAQDKRTDKKFEEYQTSILEAVNFGFQKNEERFDKIEASIDRLAITLDHFLNRLTTHEEEFAILKAEVNMLKKIVKDKLGVEVTLQG